ILPGLVFDQDKKSFHYFIGRILALLLYIVPQVDKPERLGGFKGLHGITSAQLVLLVCKVTAVFNKVNAAKLRVTTVVRVSTARWIKCDKIEAGTTATTLTAKLPILNPEEYDLWLMRIEQYFLMTDYSLWEVIKNGNKVQTKTVRTVEQTYEPTSVEEKLDIKNGIKTSGTLLMAHPNKDQLKFHSYQNAKLLMETIEKRSKVEYYKCHKNKHFARECKAPKNQENRGREYGRKTMPVENPIEKAVIAQYGFGGYDWSYQAEEEHSTNYALMALTSSGSSSSLDYVENVKSRSDKGYHALLPPYSGNYIPPKPDLMFIDEQVKSEFVDVVSNVSSSAVKTVESKFESVNVKNKGVYNTVQTKPVRKNNFSPPIIKDWNYDDESEVEFEPKVEVKIVRPFIEKIKFVKIAREKGEKVETPKQHKHYPRGNQRNWNNLMS
nr:hypothetical protein [Tanacetum cinerariifolium]